MCNTPKPEGSNTFCEKIITSLVQIVTVSSKIFVGDRVYTKYGLGKVTEVRPNVTTGKTLYERTLRGYVVAMDCGATGYFTRDSVLPEDEAPIPEGDISTIPMTFEVDTSKAQFPHNPIAYRRKTVLDAHVEADDAGQFGKPDP